MKIALFTDTFLPDINGVATSVAILREELIAHGHDVLVVTTVLPKGSDYVDTIPVIRVKGLDLKHLYGYRMAPFYSMEGMKDVEAFAPDVIHVQTEFGVGLFARIVGLRLHIPVVYTYHTMWEDYSHYLSAGIKPVDVLSKGLLRKLSRLYGMHCTELIVPSDKAAKRLASYGITRPINVVSTGLRLDRFIKKDEKKVAAIKKQYGLDKRFVILFLGRIAEEKSIEFLIHAMKKIIPIRRDVLLLIVGGGPSEKVLQEMAHKEHLDDYVIFTGAKDSEDVPAFYQVADVFASASLSETQGLTYIEAMASGLPVFARYDSNLEGVIMDGRNGFFFRDEREYVAKLMQLSDEQKRIIGKQAQIDAKCHSSTLFYTKIMEVYQKALHDMNKQYKIQALEKQKDHSYKVTLSDGKKLESFIISPSMMGKLSLSHGQVIDEDIYQAILNSNKVHDCYQSALKLLMYHDYAASTLAKRLMTKGYSKETVEETISLLEEKNLINDYDYAHEVIAKTLRHQGGFEKARTHLLKEGIDAKVIDDALSEFDEDLAYQGAKALVDTLIQTNRHRSIRALKQNIRSKLIGRGYSYEIIERVLAEADFTMSDERTDALLEQEYQKVYKRYVTKYSGKELQYKLKSFLIQKGFTRDEVIKKVEAGENNGED